VIESPFNVLVSFRNGALKTIVPVGSGETFTRLWRQGRSDLADAYMRLLAAANVALA
jgi:hypothetical protein